MGYVEQVNPNKKWHAIRVEKLPIRYTLFNLDSQVSPQARMPKEAPPLISENGALDDQTVIPTGYGCSQAHTPCLESIHLVTPLTPF